MTLRKSFGPPRRLLVVIDGVREPIRIDAASDNIGGDEDADGVIFKFLKRTTGRIAGGVREDPTKTYFSQIHDLILTFHNFAQRIGQRFGSVAAQRDIDFFQAVNQIDDFVSRIRTTRSVTKMRAASKWTSGIDQTAF